MMGVDHEAVKILNPLAILNFTSPGIRKIVGERIERAVIIVRPAFEASGLYRNKNPPVKVSKIKVTNFIDLENLFNNCVPRREIKNG